MGEFGPPGEEMRRLHVTSTRCALWMKGCHVSLTERFCPSFHCGANWGVLDHSGMRVRRDDSSTPFFVTAMFSCEMVLDLWHFIC